MGRNTQQRDAIRRAFEAADRPLSPGEVLTAAQREVAQLGIATVYRNLKGLLESGWLAAVPLPDSPNRYEVAGKHHHHHFRCRGCDRVYEVDGCPPDLTTLLPPGFRLDGHEITLLGQCSECSERSEYTGKSSGRSTSQRRGSTAARPSAVAASSRRAPAKWRR